jgi:hypothetical protein
LQGNSTRRTVLFGDDPENKAVRGKSRGIGSIWN